MLRPFMVSASQHATRGVRDEAALQTAQAETEYGRSSRLRRK